MQISVVGIGVRLVGGSDSMEGRVEVFWNGAWGTVCEDLWDIQDATVICRELGFGEAYAAPIGAAFGEGTGNILLDDVRCRGNEQTVFDCPAIRGSGHNCWLGEDAGVRCTGDRPVIIICPSNQTILSDPNQTFATVNLPGPAASYHSSLGQLEITIDVDGSTRRVNDEVRLSIANSPHVLQFNASDANNSATCSMQISVVGIGVRLVGGSDSMEGRVEVFWNGAWGTVCEDLWDIQDATVICRELGFGEAYAAPIGAAFGEGTGNILLDDVRCRGNEQTVFDCPAIRGSGHNCWLGEDAGVRCTGDRPVIIICPSNQTILSDPNQTFATVNLPGPAASYHSSLGRLEITIDVDGSTRRVNDEVRLSIANSPHVLQFNASDANNSATCSSQISVLVNQPPVITCPPNQTIQTDPKQNFATVTLPEPPSASDNSGSFEITIDADGLTFRVNDRIRLGAAQSVHILQYTAKDASNNIATCTMQITVIV
ncbi:deleted in malignant brain tumors 1 protein-like [Patiria miniata]|uniref:Deleted in malignant brain tumors 1 protein-like n=1 Tax=Patiria miniata TaxID=46514 RepID=A0A913ZKT0_PATMI|nr:deleted in malignant brain tumors 1 protein-like [Patiria miniata]